MLIQGVFSAFKGKLRAVGWSIKRCVILRPPWGVAVRAKEGEE